MQPRVPVTALTVVLLLCALWACPSADAQSMTAPPLLVGYFQNTFAHVDAQGTQYDYNSFSMQQLNLILQKDLAAAWSSFVNVEFVNSYSSGKMFGDFNLEEAWVRYQLAERLYLKMGLMIPEFNRLNTIKTKMPLLPYIIRPLVYESSLREDIAIDEFVPDHAYVSLYGTIPVGAAKLDHAVYIGNSPNLSAKFEGQQSAVDTSTTFLTGFRIGARTSLFQAGISGTLDYVNLPPSTRDLIRDTAADITELPRYRLGSDLRITVGPVGFEGEAIKVWYDDDMSEIVMDKEFYYATLFVTVKERLTLYAGYWYTSQDFTEDPEQGFGHTLVHISARDRIPGFGGAYNIHDRVVAKAQYGAIDEDVNLDGSDGTMTFEFSYYGLAVSVMF